MDKLDNNQVTVSNADSDKAIGPTACFVIGDSILRDFNDDTFEDTTVKSISGGTVSCVYKELEKRKDLETFKNVVIHAGTNDVSQDIAVEETVSSMEAIITLIMVKAPTAKVFVSGLCPRTKGQVNDKVETLNAALKELTERLDCKFIDTSEHMTYRNGNIDNAQLVDGLHLSERGVQTLVKLFADAVEGLCVSTEPWSEVIKKSKKHWIEFSNSKSKSQGGSRDPAHLNGQSDTNSANPHYLGFQNTRRRQNQRFTTYTPHIVRDRDNQRNRNSRNSYRGCFNCGVRNHNQNTCRYTERIRCNKCNKLGHKANYCNDNYGKVHPRY